MPAPSSGAARVMIRRCIPHLSFRGSAPV
jgi:hypothetical protein